MALDPGTYGIPESQWDRGWYLRRGFGQIPFASLSPTAATPGVWVIRNNVTYVVVEGIRVTSDTTLKMTVAATQINPALTTINPQNRLLGASSGLFEFQAAVAALPASLTTLFTFWANAQITVHPLHVQYPTLPPP